MKNLISKGAPKMVGLSSYVFAIAFLCLLVDTLVNGVRMGDMVLCFAPLFSSLKEKMTKGLDKLNGIIKDEEDDGDDVFDKKLDSLEERFERKIERKMEEEMDIERKLKEEERKEREEEEREEREEREEEEAEEREERLKEFEEMIKAKYERGEELTPKEQFALELIMENEELEQERKRSDAEYEAKKAAEKEAKKAKRKEMFSKFGKAITGIGTNSSSGKSSATNNSQSGTSPKKEIRKVWTMKYVGPENRKAPNGFVNVPSMQQTYRPTHNEIVEALKNMGYSSADINSIAGGPDSWWEPV